MREKSFDVYLFDQMHIFLQEKYQKEDLKIRRVTVK